MEGLLLKIRVILLTLLFAFSFISVSYALEPTIDELGVLKEETTVATKPEIYIVKDGDSLYQIAIDHGISLDSLISMNNLTDHLIYPGEKLNLGSELTTVVPLEVDTEMDVIATAYTAYCYGCSGTTAYGIDLRSNSDQKVIAVDPSVIPLGTKVWVEGYGEAIAGDTGGAIKGDRIDVFIPTYDHAIEWGVRKIKIKVMD